MYLRFLMLCVSFVAFSSVSFASSFASTTPYKDTWVSGNLSTYNFGSDSELFGDARDYVNRWALFSFTMPTIPEPCAVVDRVTVDFTFFDHVGSEHINLYSLSSHTNWVESEVTFNKYNSSSNWASPGGDIDFTVIDYVGAGNGVKQFVLQGSGSDNPLSLNWGDDVPVVLKYIPDPLQAWYFGVYSRESSNPPVLTVEYHTSSCGGGSDVPAFKYNTDILVPATLYSQFATSSPTTASTSFTFTSPNVNASSSQGAVVFIVHSSSSTPTVTWNSVSMTMYESTSSLQFPNYVTSVYHVPLPSSGNVVVSNINSASIKYLYASVWNSGNLVANSDHYAVDYASKKAYIDLANYNYNVTAVGAFHTLSGLNMFNIVDNNNLLYVSTSSSIGDISVNSSSCTASYDNCYVGYSKSIDPFSYFIATGVIVGLNLYGVQSNVAVSTSTIPVFMKQIFGDRGTTDGFAQCSSLVRFGTIIDSLVCLSQNLLFWFMYLFIPAPNAYAGLQNMLFTSMNSTTSLLSSMVSIPLNFFLWTSSSSVPSYEPIGFDIPHFNGQPGYYEFRFQGTSNSHFVAIDNALYNFIDTWFPLLIFIWVGFIGFRIFYS